MPFIVCNREPDPISYSEVQDIGRKERQSLHDKQTFSPCYLSSISSHSELDYGQQKKKMHLYEHHMCNDNILTIYPSSYPIFRQNLLRDFSLALLQLTSKSCVNVVNLVNVFENPISFCYVFFFTEEFFDRNQPARNTESQP